MKKYHFGQSELNISRSAFERGVKACLSLTSPTRADVAEAANINLGYAGKILSALTECKILCEDSSFFPTCYSVNPDLSVLVIDISDNGFAVSVIDGSGERILSKNGVKIPQLSFSDYFYSLLSCAGLMIKELSCSISAICVLHDGKRLAQKGQKEIIDGIFASLFGMLPILYINLGDALASVLDFNLCPSPDNKRIAYIRISNDVTALFVTEDKSIFKCDPSRLIFQGESTVKEAYDKAHTNADMGEVISRIMTAMDFSCKIGTFIIESEYLKIDASMLEIIKRAYAATGSYLPEIYTTTLSTSYTAMAAAKLTAMEFILSLIKTK